MSAIVLAGEACDLDTGSEFFQSLPSTFENIANPLATINSTFRQQAYIAKKLPYVVRSLHTNDKITITGLFGMKWGHILVLLQRSPRHQPTSLMGSITFLCWNHYKLY